MDLISVCSERWVFKITIMKKLFLCLLSITIISLAYNQTDVDNANYLAEKNIITAQSTVAGYRLDDTITRAEVVGIALKIK